MRFSTLKEWLDWITKIHNLNIELGIDRIKVVADKLDLLHPACPVITVGGTNGKGSTVAGLEAIYLAAGYRVGAFTSPILFTHNEQVRINRVLAKDEEFCIAFDKVESARGNIPLTAFEFQTLAALAIFKSYSLDVLILEVGLGGRLDAVNIIDPDIAVVTSISLDHTEWLGDTREAIAVEKAGIFRPKKPAVCGDNDPPQTLIEYALNIDAPLYCQHREFNYQKNENSWSWSYQDIHHDSLPIPKLALQNMSTVLMIITLMQNKLAVRRSAIEKGLTELMLQGRLEVINGPVMQIFDVSHNPASVALLSKHLKEMPNHGKTYAVFSMLSDKDIITSIKNIQGIDAWYVAPLSTQRAADEAQLKSAFQQAAIQEVTFLSSIQAAYRAALFKAQPGDRIVIFGSFHTISEVKKSS